MKKSVLTVFDRTRDLKLHGLLLQSLELEHRSERVNQSEPFHNLKDLCERSDLLIQGFNDECRISSLLISGHADEENAWGLSD